MPRKRRWQEDEFAPPKVIKPLRTPRMGDAVATLPVGGAELIQSIDKFRKLIIEGANIGSLEQAVGELRAHISFVRVNWGMKGSTCQATYERTKQMMREKYPQQQHPRPRAERIIREPRGLLW